MTNNQRRLGCIALPMQLPLNTEPTPFTLTLPPMTHLLDVVVKEGIPILHFWFWENSCRVFRTGNSVMFTPNEKLTMLIWQPPSRYSGPMGVYLKSFVVNESIVHLFDLTRYNHATGEVLGVVS